MGLTRLAGRFGKLPAKLDPRTLRFGKYTPTLPAPPAAYSSLYRVQDMLRVTDVDPLFPMDGNDQYGDCTIAALAHLQTLYNGLEGKQVIMDQKAVTDLYFQLSGGQDTGLIELDVLKYWQQNAVNGEKILAYVAVDPKNIVHVRQAISLFGAVYIGFTVTSACQDQFSAGEPWTSGQLLTNEGHAVAITSYSASEFRCLTWGATQVGTIDWWMQGVDECYAILPQEASEPGFSIEGFDLEQLQADLQAVKTGG